MRNMGFREVPIESIEFNPFQRIGKQWMLVTAGDQEKFNTMTASWGAAGVMWGKNAVTVYIRPQRYTKEFIDAKDTFTLSFYGEEYRKALSLLGSVSGREKDKVKEAGLTPVPVEDTMAFEEADLVLVCRKMYHAPMPPENFDDKSNDEKWYPQKDYHVMYIAEITKALVKE